MDEKEKEKEVKQETQDDQDNEEDEFIKSLLEEDEGAEKSDEEKEAEQLRKNKDAEEARKRREKEAKEAEEAKAKAEQEAKEKAQKEAEAKKAEEEKAKKLAEEQKAGAQKRVAQEQELGKQLTEFKEKYPDIDLDALDKDPKFRSYIKGKLLGSESFTSLYEGYIDIRVDASRQSKEEEEKRYLKKISSSGSSQGAGDSDVPSDIYSEQELMDMAEKLPYMHPNDVAKIDAKYEKSIKYHESKK